MGSSNGLYLKDCLSNTKPIVSTYWQWYCQKFEFLLTAGCQTDMNSYLCKWRLRCHKKLSWRDLFVQIELGVDMASLGPPTIKRKWHIFGVYGPILTILVSIVRCSGCLSWLNLFSKWLYVKVIVKRSFSRSTLQKMSVWKSCRCFIQDINGLIDKYMPIMLTTSFLLSIFLIDESVCHLFTYK